jgi:hypothetical protein
VDRASARPEDLPPLDLRPLRELDLEEPASSGKPHLSAASGVVRRGTFAYVIGDDELGLAVFDLARGGPGSLRRVLGGELPRDEGERKRDKPDLEALSTVPPFEGNPFGGLFGLGSGSTERRDRGFFWPLAADGSLAGEPRGIDLSPLYEELRREIGLLNIEGACVFGEDLWLFHRGNKGDAPNCVARLALPALSESLGGDASIEPEEMAGLRAYDLGDLDGIELCFSDATALTDDLIVFTASAEAGDDDPISDGTIHGSVVGTIDREGTVTRLRDIDRKWKVEGVDATLSSGVIDFLFVCDQDDPEGPSPMLSATMPVEAAFDESRDSTL